MGQGNEAQPAGRDDAFNGLSNQREHFSWSCVKKKRLIVHDQILIEREPTRHDVHGRIDTIDTVSDLMDICAGSYIGNGHGSLPSALCESIA
jgi:hypothetical protein